MSSRLKQFDGAGLIHTDLHDGNILIDTSQTDNPQAYLLDLGMASKSGEWNVGVNPYGPTNAAMHALYPHYAPEVFFGGKCLPASDVYSLGVSMRDGADSKFELPEMVEETISAMMSSDPSSRPSLRQVIKVLQEALQADPEH